MNVTDCIGRYIRESLVTDVRDEDDIFDLGFANSLFALQLLLFVEQSFSIEVQRSELDIKNFSSIAALSAFVTAKLSAAAANAN